MIPTFSPQGDGNSQPYWARSATAWAVDPYLFPARGRKLRGQRVDMVSNHSLLIPTFSPQGDGNSLHPERCPRTRDVDPYLFPARGRKLAARPAARRRRRRLIPTFSPQGDGNGGRGGCIPALTLQVVDPYLFPARGRKRCPRRSRHARRHLQRVDPYLFPARGRKLPDSDQNLGRGPDTVDPYLFPARGRKPLYNSSLFWA